MYRDVVAGQLADTATRRLLTHRLVISQTGQLGCHLYS